MIGHGRWLFVPRPQSDELMSSWLYRLALANNRSPHSLCTTMFGRVQLWTRDLDRHFPSSLLEVLANYTGLDAERLGRLLLVDLIGTVTEDLRTTGSTGWLLPLGIYHRTRRRPGLQFCPQCLATPPFYARRMWRAAFVTECITHRRPLLDHCPKCSAPFVMHRMKPDRASRWCCTQCGTELASCSPEFHASPVRLVAFERRLIAASSAGFTRWRGRWVHSLGLFEGLRCLVRTCTSTRLRSLAKQIGVEHRVDFETRHCEFEYLGVESRRRIMHVLAGWLEQWPERLLNDVSASRSQRSGLLRDRRPPPLWVQSAFDCLPTANPHLITTTEVDSCLRWMIAAHLPLDYATVEATLGLTRWERLLMPNRKTISAALALAQTR